MNVAFAGLTMLEPAPSMPMTSPLREFNEMPRFLLPVTHLRQSSEATCLAACARMALAYAGDLRPERELIELLGIDPSYGAIVAPAR